MRACFLSVLLVLCTLLASEAAPIDPRAPKFSLSSKKPAKVKAAPIKAPAPAKLPPPPPVKVAPPPPPPAKVAPPPPPPVKATPPPPPAKAAPPPPPVKATPPPPPVVKPAPPKATVAPPAGKACPVGKKPGVKGRSSDCEDVDPCTFIEDCATCVGAGLKCGFDVKNGKCVAGTTSGLTLAKDKKSCDTLLAAAQAAAPPAVDARVTAAAQTFFSANVKTHVFVGDGKKTSGRHILSAWTSSNPNSKELKRNAATGVVEFQNGQDIKTVWNDKASADGTIVYTRPQLEAICLRGYELSILANPSNAATLRAPAAAAAAPAAGKKGKGKAAPAPAALKLTAGLNNGFVVHNPVINANICVNINSASCFPLGLGTTTAAEGAPCTGDGTD